MQSDLHKLENGANLNKMYFCRTKGRLSLPKDRLYSGKYSFWKNPRCHVTVKNQFNARFPCDNMVKRVNEVFEYPWRRIASSTMEKHVSMLYTVINYAQCYTATFKKKICWQTDCQFSSLQNTFTREAVFRTNRSWLAALYAYLKMKKKNQNTQRKPPKKQTKPKNARL